jgi:hypothetical protein
MVVLRVDEAASGQVICEPPKRHRDPAQLSQLIIDIADGGVEDREPTPEEQGKRASRVARGKIGGPKGGKARALKLTPE